jgi:uncharacterized SAM-binding protein YcdF (DUF218 family)
MLDAIVGVLKNVGRVSSPALWLALLTFGVLLLYVRRGSPTGRRWLTTVLLAYWFTASPIGASLLSAPLAQHPPRVDAPEHAAGACAVVVLGGGIVSTTADGMTVDDLMTSALRVIEGVRLYRLLGDPWLIMSGGNTQLLDPPRPEAAAFRDAAVRFGVPASRVLAETESRTTREQAIVIKQLLRDRGIDRFVLVTSPVHMPRSLATFRAVGLQPIPSAAAGDEDPDESPWSPVPSRKALRRSDSAVYEYAAWAYYWARGWFRT